MDDTMEKNINKILKALEKDPEGTCKITRAKPLKIPNAIYAGASKLNKTFKGTPTTGYNPPDELIKGFKYQKTVPTDNPDYEEGWGLDEDVLEDITKQIKLDVKAYEGIMNILKPLSIKSKFLVLKTVLNQFGKEEEEENQSLWEDNLK